MTRREGRPAFTKRLHQEGRYNEFRILIDKVRKEQGLDAKEAWTLCQPQFPPTGRFTPAGDLPPPTRIPWSGTEETNDFLAILTWVSDALGRDEAGERIVAASCPGPKSWGLFQWALKSKKDFYTLWAGESRRRFADSSSDELKKATAYAVAEIDVMLDELAAGWQASTPHFAASAQP